MKVGRYELYQRLNSMSWIYFCYEHDVRLVNCFNTHSKSAIHSPLWSWFETWTSRFELYALWPMIWNRLRWTQPPTQSPGHVATWVQRPPPNQPALRPVLWYSKCNQFRFNSCKKFVIRRLTQDLTIRVMQAPPTMFIVIQHLWDDSQPHSSEDLQIPN